MIIRTPPQHKKIDYLCIGAMKNDKENENDD